MGSGPTITTAPPAPAPVVSDNDQLGADSQAARQRALWMARAAAGMRSTFLTSTRGTAGAPGAGLSGPPAPELDGPIITTMTGYNDSTTHFFDTPEQKAARLAEEKKKRDAANAGQAINRGSPR